MSRTEKLASLAINNQDATSAITLKHDLSATYPGRESQVGRLVQLLAVCQSLKAARNRTLMMKTARCACHSSSLDSWTYSYRQDLHHEDCP